MTRTLLIDGDMVLYKRAFAAEVSVEWEKGEEVTYHGNIKQAIQESKDQINEWIDVLNADAVLLAFSDKENFRKTILPTYKLNRKDTHKPILLNELKGELMALWPYKVKPKLEADDVLGILATHPFSIEGEKVIVAEDKDMKQIPGGLFNPRHQAELHSTIEMGDYCHFYQTLVGDSTDNYKGCPWVGPVKAEQILAPFFKFDPKLAPSPEWNDLAWAAVVNQFNLKGLTEEDALVQAQVSRICRYQDFNFITQEPILWHPQKTTTMTHQPSLK